jgi:hypothetical protein
MAFLPRSLVDKTMSVATEYVPIVGPAFKYSRKAMKVTKMTDPVKASTRAVGYLVSACTGPIIKYPALCAMWAASGAVGITTGNPVLIAVSLEFAEMILEES